jgi:hypothetical protein
VDRDLSTEPTENALNLVSCRAAQELASTANATRTSPISNLFTLTAAQFEIAPAKLFRKLKACADDHLKRPGAAPRLPL